MERWEGVVIVGAGIAGLGLAVGLKRLGIQALVLERAHGLRTTGAAITLFPNAWCALDALGVAHKLTSIYDPFNRGTFTYVGSGRTQEVTIQGGGLGVRSVHRKVLLESLADELLPDTIRFSAKLVSISTSGHQDASPVVLRLDDGTIINAKVVIGCDGVHSAVAQWLGLGAPVDSGRAAVRALSVYPQGHGLPHEVQQFLGEGLRAGFVPLNSTDVYWFLSYNSNGDDISKDPALIQKELLENVTKNFPSIYNDVVEHTDLTTLSAAHLFFRYPWDLIFSNVSRGSVTVAGDAMHPMTPDLGQGGCLALEDAVVLARKIGITVLKHGGLRSTAVKQALEEYVRERRWRAAALITGAYLSGWVQQGGSSWLKNFIRGNVFYRFLFGRVLDATQYDCGKLPTSTSTLYMEVE